MIFRVKYLLNKFIIIEYQLIVGMIIIIAFKVQILHNLV